MGLRPVVYAPFTPMIDTCSVRDLSVADLNSQNWKKLKDSKRAVYSTRSELK